MKTLGIFSVVLASSLLVTAASAAPLRKSFGNDGRDNTNHSMWSKNSTTVGDPGYNVDAPDLADDCPDFEDGTELPGTPDSYPGVSSEKHKKN